MKKYNIIIPESINENFFELIGKKWMLITAGNRKKFNTMTASWGTFGRLWNKNVTTIYVRPTRYTYNFLEKELFFTLSFFNEKYRDILKFCGSHSGKNCDKVKETNLTPIYIKDNIISFEESYLILICKKIYFDDLNPDNFLDKTVEKEYNNDYHRIYIGEILTLHYAQNISK